MHLFRQTRTVVLGQIDVGREKLMREGGEEKEGFCGQAGRASGSSLRLVTSDVCAIELCDTGQYSNNGKCEKCDFIMSVLFIVGSLLMFLVAARYVGKIDSGTSTGRQKLICLRILTIFFQTSEITTMIKISWPSIAFFAMPFKLPTADVSCVVYVRDMNTAQWYACFEDPKRPNEYTGNTHLMVHISTEDGTVTSFTRADSVSAKLADSVKGVEQDFNAVLLSLPNLEGSMKDRFVAELLFTRSQVAFALKKELESLERKWRGKKIGDKDESDLKIILTEY
ncbi:hypothetical protein TrLO_g9528 [Triparma laevis f. longispina]|uniref:Uncharacterized protein n=1 Tax=Triparma laevis f. longispina TaxID=1714387 RepID=A0A9W7CAW9_9STRA|nr:hypothetical protein TrLO_g9528 [Triparma laevis f. longispina]